MPRKKVSNDNQSSALRQPTLAGFINSKSASMANPTEEPQPTAKTPAKSSKVPTSMESPSESSTNSTPTAEPKIEPPKRRSATKPKRTNTPKKKAARQDSPLDRSDNDSDVGALQAIRFESQEEGTHTGVSTVEVTSSSEGEEDQIISPRLKRTATQASRRIRASSGSSDSDVEVIGGTTGAPRKGKRRLKRRLMSSDEEDATETEEEVAPSPKKRRIVKGLKPSTSEEEINLEDEVDEDRIIDSRLRKRDKKTAFQQSLETLRRHRSGLSVDSAGSVKAEEEEDELPSGPSHSKWDFFKPFAGAKPSKGVGSDEEVKDEDGDESVDEEDEEENSWIVEDDGPDGVPELPVAFNMSSHQDLSHHFKIICQLFVHLVVRSPSQRVTFIQEVKAAEDSYFYAALSTVRRKIMGMRDSLITSSTWQTKYKRVLEKYPVLSMVEMDFAALGCDACNLGGRMSKVIGRVSGQPYDRSTFEPIEDSDSEKNSELGQSEDEDEKPQKQMHLGRFCAKRTQSFHEFTHWEWKLFDLLSREVRELRSTGNTGFVKVAFARGIRPPKDFEDGDGITDWLDQRGVIGMAWTEMKQMMERARNLESRGRREKED